MSNNERFEDRFIGKRHERECHNHEVLGSVQIAEREEDPHNHRFATVSGRAIPWGRGDHVHEVKFHTDTYEDHNHEFCGKTGGAIRVGDRHVHFLESVTSLKDGHRHKFRVATLLNNPIDSEFDCEEKVRDINIREFKESNKDRKSRRDGRRY